MPKVLQPSLPDPDIELLQRTLQRVGYGQQLTVDGFPSAELNAAVALFQMQHIGPDGVFLNPDRIVGQSTWWALANPSGARQKNGFPLAFAPRASLTPDRIRCLDLLLAEYRKDVHESPDGSNLGPEINTYWGHTGLLGKPWCCAFVSELLFRSLDHYPFGRHHTSVSEMVAAAQQMGRVTRSPRPLDIWCQLHSDGTGHTGFGVAIDRDQGVAATMEGNCGNRLKHGRRAFPTLTIWLDAFNDKQPEVYQPLPELADLETLATR